MRWPRQAVLRPARGDIGLEIENMAAVGDYTDLVDREERGGFPGFQWRPDGASQ